MFEPKRPESSGDFWNACIQTAPARILPGMSLRSFLCVAGLLLAIFGVAFGFWKVDISRVYPPAECGSVFTPERPSNLGWALDGSRGQSPTDACDDKLSGRTSIVWVSIALGLLVAAGAAVTGRTTAAQKSVDPGINHW
jgi:hypothetical protein